MTLTPPIPAGLREPCRRVPRAEGSAPTGATQGSQKRASPDTASLLASSSLAVPNLQVIESSASVKMLEDHDIPVEALTERMSLSEPRRLKDHKYIYVGCEPWVSWSEIARPVHLCSRQQASRTLGLEGSDCFCLHRGLHIEAFMFKAAENRLKPAGAGAEAAGTLSGEVGRVLRALGGNAPCLLLFWGLGRGIRSVSEEFAAQKTQWTWQAVQQKMSKLRVQHLELETQHSQLQDTT